MLLRIVSQHVSKAPLTAAEELPSTRTIKPSPRARPDLEYFKPDYAEDTGPETYHQVDGLEDAQARAPTHGSYRR
jgi:hypothetical protein